MLRSPAHSGVTGSGDSREHFCEVAKYGIPEWGSLLPGMALPKASPSLLVKHLPLANLGSLSPVIIPQALV